VQKDTGISMPGKLKNVMMNVFKNIIKTDTDITSYMNENSRLRPFFVSVKIALAYGTVGIFWILFSSKMLHFFVTDLDELERYEIYKGWLFVVMTTILVFCMVLRNMFSFAEIIDKFRRNYLELNTAHEKLLEMEANLSRLAYTDYLTGLPNKRALEKEVQRIGDSCDQSRYAVLYLDVDNFKNINDTLGHNVGDELLVEISRVIDEVVRKPDMAFRISGDEFAVIFADAGTTQEIDEKLAQLLEYIRKPWSISGHHFFITYSVGITIYPDDGISMNKLLMNADTAMYAVKKETKDSYAYYSMEIMEKNIRKVELANELRQAVDNGEFILLYQPIKNLGKKKIVGVEALIRWKHPVKGFVSPVEFIPLAEETGMIYEIDKWVLRTVSRQKKEWEENGLGYLKISINLSGSSLVKTGLVECIEDLIEEYGIDCSLLQIEVTETALMENIRESAVILEKIRRIGIKIALDDFGTGYSSFTYLKNLPIDVVKLDRQFIWDMMNVDQVDLIVKSVIQLTHDLLLEIVAEGIETEKQLDYLMLHNCDYGQGYLFSRPLSKEDIELLCCQHE